MRLIDADEFRKEVQEYVLPITTNNLMGAGDAYHRIMHLLDDAPTIEAEPVKHGRWDYKGNCSACGKNIYDDIDAYMIWSSYEPPHCPNCGAKMDGERRKDE